MAQRRKGRGMELPFAPMARAPRRDARRKAAVTTPPAPDPATQPDLFTVPPPRARRRLTYLDITALGLGRVDMGTLRAGTGPDGYLYHVTTQEGLDTIQARGTLVFSERAPLVLTERTGVAAWLADMMEHDAPDGPPVIFRVRRFMVDDLLENDPDRTRGYGVSFYLLTGIDRSEQ
mgnify:FL=1